MGRFDDQVAWITGASSGIGQALARELAREGADVAISARRADRLEALASEIQSTGRNAIAVPCDVTDEADVERAANEVVARLGRMDVAVANAGFGVTGRVESLTADDWRRQLDTNVVGAAITARHALPHLRKTRGSIVLVASVAAFVPSQGQGAYIASKAALRAIGQVLALELSGTGVTCTTIHPGFVESEIAQVDNAGHHDPSRDDPRPRALMWKADKAAETMARAIARRDREFVFTVHGKVGAFLGQHAPGLVHQVLARAPVRKKRATDAG